MSAGTTTTQPNARVKVNGKTYRVCVYEIVGGWSSFVEDRHYNYGFTGKSTTRREAWIKALWTIPGVTGDDLGRCGGRSGEGDRVRAQPNAQTIAPETWAALTEVGGRVACGECPTPRLFLEAAGGDARVAGDASSMWATYWNTWEGGQ